MNPDTYLPIVFPLLFGAGWIAITSFLSMRAGWFALASQFPDRAEEPFMKTYARSGVMGRGVQFSNILNFAVCPSGLRVSINRLFGPFSKPFFVPWESIRVERRTLFLWRRAVLRFGGSETGKLTISADLADRLARASQGRWPEVGPFPPETPVRVLTSVIVAWLLRTAFVGLFFTIVPAALVPLTWPAAMIIPAIAFPAVVFGIGAVVEYVRRIRR